MSLVELQKPVLSQVVTKYLNKTHYFTVIHESIDRVKITRCSSEQRAWVEAYRHSIITGNARSLADKMDELLAYVRR